VALSGLTHVGLFVGALGASLVAWGAPPPLASGPHEVHLQVSRAPEEPPPSHDPVEPSFEIETPRSSLDELTDLVPVEIISDPLPFPEDRPLDAVDATLDFPGRTVFERPTARPAREPAQELPILQPATPETPDPASAATPLSVEVPPELLRLDSPVIVYPSLAQRRGQEGTVLCRLTIDAQGRVTKALLETSSGHAILDETALAGVLLWRYRPGTREGVAAEMDVLQQVDFRK